MKKLDFITTPIISETGVAKVITYKALTASDLFIAFITDYDKFDDYNFYGKYRGADYRMYVYLSKLDSGVERKEYYDNNEAALSAVLGIETSIIGLEAIVSDGGGTVNLTHKATDNIPKLKAMRNDLLFPLVKTSPELAEDLLNEITFNNSYITYDKGSDSDEK